MDVILEAADHYLFNTIYRALPAIPIPDLVAGIHSIPSLTDIQTAISSTPLPTYALTTVSNFWNSCTASGLTLDALPQDNVLRQLISLFFITLAGAHLMYFVFAWTSYTFVFDHNHKKHPKFLKNQVKLEIQMSMKALPGIAICTIPWFLGEVRGHSKLYSHIHASDALQKVAFNPPSSVIQETVAAAVASAASAAGLNATAAAAAESPIAFLGPLAALVEPFMDGWGYVVFSIVAFLLFTDCGIYWIHRLEHHPLIYKRIHKPHHKWIIPTPFSSHAFHFMDGYAQSVPYHLFVYLVPMHKFIYLAVFGFVNFWSVMIHDGEYLVHSEVINSAAHHSVHHLYFNYNYGQYFTLWDRIGGSYRGPTQEQYNKERRMDKKIWSKQAKEVESFDEFGKPIEGGAYAAENLRETKNVPAKKTTLIKA